MLELNQAALLMARKLHGHYPLGSGDVAELTGLPFAVRALRPADYLVREGQTPTRCAFLIDGFTYRHKLTASGDRQIVAINVPGEFVDLQNLFLQESDHNLQALTAVTIAEIPIATLQKLVFENPAVGRALWVASLIEASIYREWLLNVGRRSALGRLAHLICEFLVRLEENGVVDDGYMLPMTQEQMGDALGLTAVHVNRILGVLQREGLIERNKRHLYVIDRAGLARTAEFNSRYLHPTQD